jgi:hypothetical protein
MPTTQRDILKAHIATVQGATRRLVDDVTEQESLVTIDGFHNHIKWLTGHLAWTATLSVKVLGGEAQFSSSWTEIFRRGAPTPPKALTSPAWPEVRTQLFALHKQILDLIELSDDDKLVRVVEIDKGWENSPSKAMMFFSAHEFYHAGQMAIIRRTLARDRSFG